ncbi:hypothetical protein Vadar_019336 [Vaccinium darrowii]|uniref:Uncharacterized protein n=1 Tax=Vaccinium darrowii TaxID=229202 RepID=A0ACB7Y0X5_9ERIC|nr:hypothetical protein Vadar_019336 [Vaccinium darrowii]
MATLIEKRKKKYELDDFLGPDCPMSPLGPFGDDIVLFLRECTEPEEYKVDGMQVELPNYEDLENHLHEELVEIREREESHDSTQELTPTIGDGEQEPSSSGTPEKSMSPWQTGVHPSSPEEVRPSQQEVEEDNPPPRRSTRQRKPNPKYMDAALAKEEIDVSHVKTKNQVADNFTEGLRNSKLSKFRKQLGMKSKTCADPIPQVHQLCARDVLGSTFNAVYPDKMAEAIAVDHAMQQMTFLSQNPLRQWLILFQRNYEVFSPYPVAGNFVSKHKYHLIIPLEEDEPLAEGVLGQKSHLLHGMIHSNGFGHLIRINGIEGGSKYISGTQLMHLWDRICTRLHARKVSVRDVSRKQSVDLRLLYGIAYGNP